MGLIKLAQTAVSSVMGSFSDQYLEFVDCPQVDNDVIIQKGNVHHGDATKKYHDGVITNGSVIVVPVGMAMLFVDNGQIKEFSSVPGEYKWDQGTETSVFAENLGQGIMDAIKTGLKRITFGGQTAKDQRVYYINIKTIAGNTFGSTQPEVMADPNYGSVEVTYNGEYSIKIDNPVLLINEFIGSNPKDTLTYDDIFSVEGGQNMLKSSFSQKISEAIANVMTIHNVSFNMIQNYKSDITEQMNHILDEKWHNKYGIIVEDVTVRINATEESKKIIREMDSKLAETRRMGQVYGGVMNAAVGESLKNAASNENGAMMGFMGMGMAGQNGANIMGAFNNAQAPSENPNFGSTPAPGTIFGGSSNTDSSVNNSSQSTSSKVCSNCGLEVTGKFCANCGTEYVEPVQQSKKCSNCGAELTGKFCSQCGTAAE